MNATPKFRLFRLTQPMHNGCTHAGEVWIGNRMWALTARVVDTPNGRQFHGEVQGPAEAIRKKPEEPKPPAADDLVAQAEGMPFDDPISEAPF